MSVGYIYVFLNQSHSNSVKIGKTTKHPNERVKELSGTSQPHPFLVAYYEKVSDCDSAEKRVHRELRQFRINPNREFFKISSTEAIKAVQRIAAEVNLETPFPVAGSLAATDSSLHKSLPARLYAVSFSCEKCGEYKSCTVERFARIAVCLSCQHENPISVDYS